MAVSSSQILLALGLTFIGSSSTALGGLLVVLQKKPDVSRLGLLQGFAAGLMLSLSFFDLLPNAINAVGFLPANLWFFAGVAFFAIIVTFIPEPSLGDGNEYVHKKTDEDLPDQESDLPSSELLKAREEAEAGQRRRRQVLFSGIVTAVGISIHNFPEGIAVFLGSLKGLRVGLSLAIAIALHNVPEGLAVALPIFYSTGSRWQAVKISAISGLVEPLAVVFAAAFLPVELISDSLIEGALAAVGGVMAFLVLNEMLPLAFQYAGSRVAGASVFLGMAVMSANLYLLQISLPSDIAL